MKNLFKVFGIIALVAIIGFSFAACGGGDSGGGGGGSGGGGSGGGGGGGGTGGNGSMGNTLKITNAQVYSVSYIRDTPRFTEFNNTVSDLNYLEFSEGNSTSYKSLNVLIEGSPSVTLINGKLNITLGTPKASSLENLDMDDFQGLTVSTTGVKVFSLDAGFFNSATNPTFNVGQFQTDGNYVMYIYVNKDVNITGTTTDTDEESEKTDITTYAMYLKTGWNSVIATYTPNATGTDYNMNLKTGTPPASYKWIIQSTDDL